MKSVPEFQTAETAPEQDPLLPSIRNQGTVPSEHELTMSAFLRLLTLFQVLFHTYLQGQVRSNPQPQDLVENNQLLETYLAAFNAENDVDREGDDLNDNSGEDYEDEIEFRQTAEALECFIGCEGVAEIATTMYKLDGENLCYVADSRQLAHTAAAQACKDDYHGSLAEIKTLELLTEIVNMTKDHPSILALPPTRRLINLAPNILNDFDAQIWQPADGPNTYWEFSDGTPIPSNLWKTGELAPDNLGFDDFCMAIDLSIPVVPSTLGFADVECSGSILGINPFLCQVGPGSKTCNPPANLTAEVYGVFTAVPLNGTGTEVAFGDSVTWRCVTDNATFSAVCLGIAQYDIDPNDLAACTPAIIN